MRYSRIIIFNTNFMRATNTTINQTTAGRKKGSQNKLTPNSKEKLLELFNEDIRKIHKSLNYVSPDEKFVKLRPIVELLCKGNDEVSRETRNIIFEKLEDEFKKLKSYLCQLPADKRAIEMRKYLLLLDKEQIETALNNMK